MEPSINPGTGPLADATEEHALLNIAQFVADCGYTSITWQREPALDKGGRFAFRLCNGIRYHSVLMPGLPLKQVRFLDAPGQNIGEFPRLYVNGSSWFWKWAVLSDPDHWTEKCPA